MDRRTSPYTLRLADTAAASRVAEHLPVTDHGATTVGFRAKNDEEAMEKSTAALEAAGVLEGAWLTTGLGVHKRTVATQD